MWDAKTSPLRASDVVPSRAQHYQDLSGGHLHTAMPRGVTNYDNPYVAKLEARIRELEERITRLENK